VKLNLKHKFNKLIIISLAWILLEGIFRKWVLPSLAVQLFAVKYLLFLLTYLTYFFHKPNLEKLRYPYQLFITLFIIWCLFQITNNPLNAPPLIIIFGYINYLFFIPLVIVTISYFNKIEKIEKLIQVLAWVSLPMYIIGIIQYFSPSDHFINSLVNDEQSFSKVSIYIRSNSIFTFVKNYNSYLLLVIPLFICRIFYLLEQNKKITFYLLLLLLGTLNMFMTASRLPIFLLGVFILIIFGYIFLQISGLRKSILTIFVLMIMSSIGLYIFNGTFRLSIDSFFDRIEMTEMVAQKGIEGGYSSEDRLIDRLDIFKFSNEAGMLGFGMGTTYQGTGFFLSKKREDIKYEEEGERVVLEIGVIGGIMAILMRLFIFTFSLRFLFKIRSIKYLLLTLPFILQLIPPLFFLNSITFSYIDCFIYWFSFGIILALKNLYFDTVKI